jgi:hypothetical protein
MLNFYFRFTNADDVCKYFVMIVTSLFTRLCIRVLAVHQIHQPHRKSSKAYFIYIIPFKLKKYFHYIGVLFIYFNLLKA